MVTEKIFSADSQRAASALEQPGDLGRYFNFDESFFKSAISSEAYRNILKDPTLQAVLSGQVTTENITPSFLEEINNLIKEEDLPIDILLKHEALRNIEPLVKVAGVESVPTDNSGYISGRTINHLYRLLLPDVYYKNDRGGRRKAGQNKICSEFASDYIREISQRPAISWEEAKVLRNTIGGEGAGSRLFWTISPYINYELKNSGLSAASSIDKILSWVNTAWQKQRESEGSGVVFNWETTYIRHIDHRPFKPQYLDHHLGLDERLPSHLFAQLYAKSVVEEMMIEK